MLLRSEDREFGREREEMLGLWVAGWMDGWMDGWMGRWIVLIGKNKSF
jgi:hypothetical protein